jgi:hypothetical protein
LPELIGIFEKIARIIYPGMEIQDDIERAYLNFKGKRFVCTLQIHKFLISRYNQRKMVDKIMDALNFDVNPIIINGYCQTIEKFLKKTNK